MFKRILCSLNSIFPVQILYVKMLKIQNCDVFEKNKL